LCIKDTGIGINEKDLPLIFDRFYMADKGRSRDNDSSGIGLSIVKRVVDYYKFKIDVESKVGLGSSFTIHF
jgi:two-component system phosphate regulon sensor histidine kinase PhoR